MSEQCKIEDVWDMDTNTICEQLYRLEVKNSAATYGHQTAEVQQRVQAKARNIVGLVLEALQEAGYTVSKGSEPLFAEVKKQESTKTEASPENLPSPEELFNIVQDIRKQRTKQYASTKVIAHRILAQMVVSIVEMYYRIKLPPPPAKLGALFMVALKVQRAATNKPVQVDDYVDMTNYSVISYECAVDGDAVDK